MNSSRQHTDGERHEGDTTRIQPLNVEKLTGDMMTPRDFTASIYLIQNQDRPDEEWEPLPEGIDAMDVVRAVRRQAKRREELRDAIEAAGTKLRTPLPQRPHTPADQRIDRSEDYTGRVPFWFAIVVIVAVLLMAWGIFDIGMRLKAAIYGGPAW